MILLIHTMELRLLYFLRLVKKFLKIILEYIKWEVNLYNQCRYLKTMNKLNHSAIFFYLVSQSIKYLSFRSLCRIYPPKILKQKTVKTQLIWALKG